MIEKIINLSGVGLLYESLPKGAIKLKRLTAIYGENGCGKSTLATVFRSLADADKDAIINKKL